MASKLVVDRQRAAGDVIASAETHARDVAQMMENLLKPLMKKGTDAFDAGALMASLARLLREANDAMVAADEAHLKELGDDAAPRTARDEVASRLYDRLVEEREIVAGLFGEAAARGVGFDGGTPREPLALVRFAQRVADALAQNSWGKPRVPGARFDGSEAASAIIALQKELEGHLKTVDLELREAQASYAHKQQMMDAFDQRFAAVATVLEGLYRLAGKPEAADRVRPSVRRPGQTATEGEPRVPVTPASP